VSDPARAAKRKNAAAQAVDSAKQQAKDRYHQTMTEIKSPGRMHRAKQYLLAQLPYRRQYLEPGTRFDADLEAPVNFGSAARVSGQLAFIGTAPAPDSTLHARLAGNVSSATAHRGTRLKP
jgi:hypothetical protein